MSKVIRDFFVKARSNFDVTKKFKTIASPGDRILPSPTTKHDTDYQLRLDAGELIDNRYRNIVLQVNFQAKNNVLRDWVKKQNNLTHQKLATARFDTQAEDLEQETDRVLEELENQAHKSL